MYIVVWWMSGVVDVRCGGCLVWWMSGVVDVCVVDVVQSRKKEHLQKDMLKMLQKNILKFIILI